MTTADTNTHTTYTHTDGRTVDIQHDTATPIAMYDGASGELRIIFIQFLSWDNFKNDSTLLTYLWGNDIIPQETAVEGVYQMTTFLNDAVESGIATWDRSGDFDADPVQLLANRVAWSAVGHSLEVSELNPLYQMAKEELARRDNDAVDALAAERLADKQYHAENAATERVFVKHAQRVGEQHFLRKGKIDLTFFYKEEADKPSRTVQVDGYALICRDGSVDTGLFIHRDIKIIGQVVIPCSSWVVTHSGSGLSLSVSLNKAGVTLTKGKATVYAALMAGIFDWTPASVTFAESKKVEIMQIVNDFIAYFV